MHAGFPSNAFWAGVQALGTIGALGLAVWLPRRQEFKDRVRFRATVLSYASMVSEAVRALATYAGDYNFVADKVSLEQISVELKLPMIIAAAEQLPLERLQSAEGAVLFTRLLGAAQTYQDALKRNVAEFTVDGTINGLTIRRFAADRVAFLERKLANLLSLRG